jgi:putative peptidoglycan lipid II flippase
VLRAGANPTAAAWGLREAMAELVPGEGKLHAFLDLAVVGLVYLGIYLGVARLLRISEVTDVMRLVTRRLARKG